MGMGNLPEGVAGLMPTLSGAFRRERGRARAQLERVVRLAGNGSWEEASAAFLALDRGLRSTLRMLEERILPLAEIKAGCASELTRRLADEHRAIEEALSGLDGALRDRRAPSVAAGSRDLRRALDEHDGSAGRLILPLLDRLLTDAERRRLLGGGGRAGPRGGPASA
jgi:hypothetical protein